MGKFDRVIAVGALLCACSSNTPTVEEQRQAAAEIPRAKAALPAPEPDPRFDAEGKLRPGTLKLAWFTIPVGFERVPGSTEQTGYFEAVGVTPDQLRRYIDVQGHPGAVDTSPHGEIYTNVMPNHTKLPLPPLEVTMLIVDARQNKLRLLVEDHTPTEPVLPLQQAMEKLAKARDTTE
jgi:hypothetical protein